jgi:hypothetical protein
VPTDDETSDGGGYVEVVDPRQYDMPASVPVDREGQMQVVEVYSTSVTHQLRCLVRHDIPPLALV